VTVHALDLAGDRIKHIWAVRNPDKLPALEDRLTRVCVASGPLRAAATQPHAGPGASPWAEPQPDT
jgi:hypothetical protein